MIGQRLRPFSFMFPMWGERYRGFFVDRCLPSLMAPGNLPLLRAADGHQILIATTDEDRQAIEHLPIMQRVSAHAAPKWIQITHPETVSDPFGQYTVNIRHMGMCLRLLVEAAYRDQTYGCSLRPDVIVSDGVVASMLRSAQAGHHLVLCSALRQIEEAVLGELVARKMFPPSRGSLRVPPRLAADLAIRHLHPETFRFDESGLSQESNPPFRFWRVPGGIILHTFYAVPILMDFSVVPSNHTACLDSGAFEDVYIGANFSHCGGVRFIQDSDEFMILSLAPQTVNWSVPAPSEGRRRRSEREQIISIRQSVAPYTNCGRDIVKTELFRVAFRWHTGDFDDAWTKEENRIESLIEFALAGPSIAKSTDVKRYLATLRDPHHLLLELSLKAFEFCGRLRNIAGRFREIARRI